MDINDECETAVIILLLLLFKTVVSFPMFNFA